MTGDRPSGAARHAAGAGGTPQLVRPTAALLARAPAVARHHLATLPVHRALIRVVECLLVGAEPLPHPLLDVGCGDGHFAAACLGKTVEAGIDPSAASAGEAQRTGAYRQVYVASADHLPFADGSFAGVLSNCVLEHIPPLDAALAEMARVLRPGGALVITVVGERFADSLFWPQALRRLGLESAARAYGRWFNRISYHFNTLSKAEWTARLGEAGFHVEKWTSYLRPDAMRVFDLSHYYGAPTLLTKRLTGRWILWPGKRAFVPWERALERMLVHFARQVAVPDGAYYFFVARKR